MNNEELETGSVLLELKSNLIKPFSLSSKMI